MANPHQIELLIADSCSSPSTHNRSGESRSLMKELANEVASDEERFGTLKLRVLYHNAERMLADAIGASDGITVLYCHNTFSYKYSGKLRVQNVLSSVHYVMSLPPDELPLKSLTTPEELGDFLDSTDKAVLLFEFCGWTPKLLSMNNKFNEDFIEENNVTLPASEMNRRKGIEDDVLPYGTDIGLSAIHWSTQFSSANDSVFKEADNSTSGSDNSCNIIEFKQLESFLPKFVEVARESILPPERVRFAFVGERSLVTLLNIDEPSSWLVAVHVKGCRGCLKAVRQIDDLRSVLWTQPIPELEDDQQGVELPANRPTIILFVDCLSKSMQIIRESHEALDAYRQLVQHYGMPDQKNHAKTAPVEINQGSQSAPHPRLRSNVASKKLLVKDKMSIMIINEGKQFTLENLIPELQGSSMHEILTYALKRKKELKLSSLAKEAGFQLLSKDFDVEVVESSPHDGEAHSNQVTAVEDGGMDPVTNNVQMSDFTSNGEHEELPSSGDVSGETVIEKRIQKSDITSRGGHEVLENPADDHKVGTKIQEPDHSSNEESLELQNSSGDDYVRSDSKRSLDDISVSFDEHVYHEATVRVTDSAAYWKIKEIRHAKEDGNEKQKDYEFSFFFADSQYRLLETLTGGSKVPSVIIIDPFSKQHYVLADQSVISYSLLSAFVGDFSSGLLHPYVQSASTISSSRESLKPPFVNMDFHETDSIPQLEAHTFTEVVVNSKSAYIKNSDSWDRNVLVLFSNSFCGFCQRMELVVREVYRAIKAYAKMKINYSRTDKLKHHRNDMWQSMPADDAISKLPSVYLMDCTHNDCSLITKPIIERELYPLLVLFPAGKKNETVIYEEDITVSDIIKFLAAHGSPVQDLIVSKTTLQDHHSVTPSKSQHHEVLLKDQLQQDTSASKQSQMNIQFPVTSHETPQVFAGCILTATENLLNSHPVDASKILILKADPSCGFLGLIINKHISWESLDDLGKGFEFLNEARLSFGGPVLRHGMPFVALTHKFAEDRYVEILPNVYFVDQLAITGLLEEIKVGNESVLDYWLFLGYSKWGWEQLFVEIAQGAWNVREGDMEQLEWPWR